MSGLGPAPEIKSPTDRLSELYADHRSVGGFSRQWEKSDDREETWTYALLRWNRKFELEQSVAHRYGTSVMINTNFLVLPKGRGSLAAKGPDGQPLKWTFWFPHRWALFDVFKGKKLPSDVEMEARVKFCENNIIAYGYCEPGWRATEDDITRWLDKAAPLER